MVLAFINNYNIRNIKSKLIILYILNVTDILFTLLLLGTGSFIEANALMIGIVKSPLTSFFMKCVIPAAMLLYIYIRIQKATDKQLKISNTILNLIAAFYCLINIMHLFWLIWYQVQ